MEKKDYEKLNNYLNDIFIILDKYDSFFIRNISALSELNDDFIEFINKYNLEENTEENNLTYEDVYSITRNIIESIEPLYLKDYDNLIKDGKLDFGYENEYDDSCFVHKNSLINIRREFNYNDVIALVHEFIHYTNGKGKKSESRYQLTEFLSIYFEIYALDYLMKQGIERNQISIYDRLKSAINHAKSLYNYEIIFLAYEKFGAINENTITYLNKYYVDISKEDFEKECKNLLKHIIEQETKYKQSIRYEKEYETEEFIYEFCSPFFSNYRYLLGTLLAYYARAYSKIENIVYLNNHINDFDLCDLPLPVLLNKIGININDKEFKNKVFDSIDSYINEYTNQKSR